jgi:hypothetical protein
MIVATRPQCVEEVLTVWDIEYEADDLVEALRLAIDEDIPLGCRLYGSVAEQTHTINSDIDIIVAEIPGYFTESVLELRGYRYVMKTGGDGQLPVRFMWHHPALDLSLDLLWFGEHEAALIKAWADRKRRQ